MEEDEASENLSMICKVLVDVSRLAGRKDIALVSNYSVKAFLLLNIPAFEENGTIVFMFILGLLGIDEVKGIQALSC